MPDLKRVKEQPRGRELGVERGVGGDKGRKTEISLQVDDISNLILCIDYINTLFS